MITTRDDITDHAIRIYGTLCMTCGLVMGFLLARIWQ